GPGQPIDRSRGRQPRLANSFRPGPGGNGGGFWHARKVADSSGVARLAVRALHAQRLGPQSSSQADRVVGYLPAILSGIPRTAGEGPRKPFAGTRPETSADRRRGSR